MAKYCDLNMYVPNDAIKLLEKRGAVCWLDMELDDFIKNNPDKKKNKYLAYDLLIRKFGVKKEKEEIKLQ